MITASVMKELKSRMTNLKDAEDVIEKVYY